MERSRPTAHNLLPKVATRSPCASHTCTAKGDPSLAVAKMTNKTSLNCPEPLGAFGSNIYRCVVQLEALDSKYLRLPPLKATEDTKENGTIHECSTLSLRGTSQHTRLERSFTVCSAVKRTFPATDKQITDIPQKQKRIQAKEVRSKQASRKVVEGLKRYPVVSLCNIANIFKIPADSLNVRCILSKELQKKSVRCFKRGYSDRPCVEFLPGPCMNVEISNDLHVHPDSKTSSIGQRPQDTPDVTTCLSGVILVGNCDIHVKSGKTCINNYDNYHKKRMSLTNGKISFFPQDSRLNDSITMHMSSSTPVSPSCELEPFSGSFVPCFPKMVRMGLSAVPPSNPSSCDKTDRVEKNTCTRAGSVLTMEAKENKLSVGKGRETDPDRDEETDREIAESFSCQRTTPYLARVFCSRTCIVWPFSNHGSFQKNFIKWNNCKPVSGLSTNAKCDSDSAHDFATNFNTSDSHKKTNSATAQDTGRDIKAGNQHPTFPEQEVNVQAKNVESFTLHAESGSVALSDFLGHSKQKTLDDTKVCNASPTISAKVNQERNTCVKENSQLGVTKSGEEQRPSLNVLKNFEKKHSGSIGSGVSELRKLQVASKNVLASSFPSGSSTNAKPKWESREFSFPQVTMVCASLSSDDDLSSLSSEEGLVDDVYPLCGVIMCDIRDTPTSSPKEPSYSRKEGASGGKMDLSTAYEEDALVLDIIQDDPDLFGNISEETTEKENKKSQAPSVFKAKSPKDSPVTRTNHIILWDGKKSDPRESKVKSECLGYPDIGTEWCINNDFKWNVQKDKEDSRAQQRATAPGSSDGRVDCKVYCKYYFSIHHSCFRKPCFYLHVPTDRDEKFCMEVVQNFSRSVNPSHLQRAVAVFVGYYQKCSPGIHFCLEELKFLLKMLFSRGFVKDLIDVLRVSTFHKILLPPEFILSLFEYVRLYGFHVLTADLINITSLCVDAGSVFTVEHFMHMQYCLESLKTPSPQMNLFQAIKHRALNSSVCNMKTDLPHIFSEVEMELFHCTDNEVILFYIPLWIVEYTVKDDFSRCKEQEDWASLGYMFCNLCLSSCSLPDLHHFSSIISRALLKDQTAAPLPFIPFVRAVCQGSTTNEVIKNLLGHIGVTLMFEYYKSQHWKKGRMLLDVLNKQNISYIKLKALFGNKEAPSLCWTVSVAAEVFLNTGNLAEAFDLLKDTLDVSQYGKIFNQHLKSCTEKQSLTMAFNTTDFMIMKDILVNQSLLQSLIHKLGRQNIWRKARLLYKYAMSVGYYPVTQVDENCKVLPIPHTLTEIEMTIAIEMFMATNASDIWGQTQRSQLQIVLKRKVDMELITKEGYCAAGNSLLSTAQITSPKLVIKYTRTNLSKEQVFILEPRSASKWLNQNIKWTTEIWQQPSHNPGTSDCPSS